ncbi:hypothetical protein BC829DRAFT_439936 [Chytridium lagenaria]|nr:hypothetical protein BC829DRAFT_439936 [Chytridium lagenaria]
MPKISAFPNLFQHVDGKKISGYHVSRNIVAGYAPAEHVNFSMVSQRSGLSKDDIESGLKDFVHGMFRVLKRGKNVVLPMSSLGRLYFQHREIKLRFYPEFLEALSDESSQKELPLVRTTDKPLTADPSPKEDLKDDSHSTSQPSQTATEIHISERVPSPLWPTPTVKRDEEMAAQIANNEKLQLDLVLNRGGKHTHPHSGDRLWSDIKCPICKQRTMPVIEVKDQLVKKEKDQDRLLLSLSLEVDREYLRKTKAIDEMKVKAAISTAQYNHSKALELEIQRKRNGANLPMGNLFENRAPPPDRVRMAKDLAKDLHDQMTIKQSKRTREKVHKEVEDKELNEKFLREFKEAEIHGHLEKLKRRHQQQEVLAEQIRAQALRAEKIQEPMTENPFARSESLMFLYQKEKAKQLYQEQMAIIKQKREYESRIADIDRQHSLERLALSRKE